MACDLFPEEPPTARILDAGTGGSSGSDSGLDASSGGGRGGSAGVAGTGSGGVAGTGGDVVAEFDIVDGADDVNEDGPDYQKSHARVWFGTGDKKNDSYTGLRFTSVGVPRGAIIRSARLIMHVPIEQASDMSARFAAEASDDCTPYSADDPPSARSKTQAYRDLVPTEPWLAETSVSIEGLAPIVAEVVDRSGWQPGAALCIEVKGQGEANARRRVGSYDGDPVNPPRLEIVYSVK